MSETFRKGGWTISVDASRAPDRTRNLNHGNNTLIGDVPAGLTLAQGRGRYHGLRCDLCTVFPCAKTPLPAQDYCAYYPPRFKSKEAIQ